MRNRTKAVRIARSAVAFVAVLSLFGFASYAPKAATFKMSFVELAGANGGQNNVVFAFDRYVLIAPYAPKGTVTENGDLSQLDNHFLYVIDTKKPGVILSKDLTALASSDSPRTIYYPTKLTFDPDTQIVFVRGTRFEQKDGEVEAIEVIAYLHVNLGDNGKPVIDSTVISFDIKGVGGEPHSADAPTDIAVSAEGNHLVFTNGASIFTYSLDQGYLYQVDLVHPSEYGIDNSIEYLTIDRDTNVLSVYSNKKVEVENEARDQSELSFYKVVNDGTLTLLKRAYAKDLPEGASLTPGSNVAVYSDQEKPDIQYAVFATNDGSLCQLDLHTEGLSANVKQMVVFPALAQAGPDDRSARLVKYEPSKRVVGIVRQGFSARIARPVNAKRIARPVNVNLGQPMLAVAKFSKKGKVVSRNVFADEFIDQGGLTELVSLTESNEWLMATYEGKLFSTPTTGDFENLSPQFLGEIAPRTERLDYLASRGSLVAVQSFAASDDGLELIQPGSVAVGKITSANGRSLLVGAAQMISSTALASATRAPAIRRPCNIRR